MDRKKLQQMKFAAECFMRYYEKKYSSYQPMLAVADVTGEDFIVKDWIEIIE